MVTSRCHCRAALPTPFLNIKSVVYFQNLII